ncbi:MAG: class I SAM-dependent methyltransferase [Sphingomicrobium sp.]
MSKDFYSVNEQESALPSNIDKQTVEGFGQEWAAYDQSGLEGAEYDSAFDAYFSIFPFEGLSADAEGFDLGCGSGRWAAGVADRVGILHCIDPSEQALEVAKRRLGGKPNVRFHTASSDTIPLADGSQDFGYSLGVLHHIPDTRQALQDCVRKLKIGAPFLVYLYYSLDRRSAWFRGLWRTSEFFRHRVSRLPFPLRKGVTAGIARIVYWPLARTARLLEMAGARVGNFPLSGYRKSSFYTMRTDALDRFGTRLEQRFSRTEIQAMMESSGLSEIHFKEDSPYWVACGIRTG